MEEVNLEFGEYLKKLRINSDLSLRQAADKAGITHTALRKIEDKGTIPTTKNIRKLALLYGEPYEKLSNLSAGLPYSKNEDDEFISAATAMLINIKPERRKKIIAAIKAIVEE